MDRQESAELLSQLRADAERIAGAFSLTYRGIRAEHPRVKARYGACYADGLITIRLRHAKTGQPLKYSSLIDTLCHELAHLRHFDHGPQFKAFFLKLLGWARQRGIYRPGPGGETLRLRNFQPAPEALALALLPPRRNGVPVFPDPPSEERELAELAPWERRAIPGPRLQPAPDGPAAPRRRGRRKAASEATQATLPDRSSREACAPAASPRAPQQLALF